MSLARASPKLDNHDVTSTSRVVVADDDVLLREGIVSLLTARDFEVVGHCGDAEGLLGLVEEQHPDLAIIDIRMPPTNTSEGLVAAQAIRDRFPSTAILLLSAHVELEQATSLIAGGERSGYLLKSRVTDIDEFVDALDRLVDGGTVVDPALVQELIAARRVHDPLAALSPREREVLSLMAEGRSNAGIAHELFVTEGDELEESHRAALQRGSVSSAVWALERSAELTTDPARRVHRLFLAAEYAFSLGRRDKVDALLETASRLPLTDLDRARMEFLREIFEDGVPGDARRVLELCALAKRSADVGDDDLVLNLLLGAALRCWWSDTGPSARTRVVTVLDELPHLEDDPRFVAALATAEPFLQAARVMDRLSGIIIEGVTDAEALRLFGMAASLVGDAVRALDFLSRAETKLREEGRLAELSQVLMNVLAQRVELGGLDHVESIEAEARSLAQETGQSLWGTGSVVLEALIAGLRGDNERAQALASEVEQLATSRRLTTLLTLVQIARGTGWLAAGRYPEAFDALARIFNPADPSYHAAQRCRGVMLMAEAAIRADRVEQARAIIADLERAALITPSPTLHVQLSYARAVVADDGEAESLYLAALSQDLVRRPWARARLELAYGSWLRRQRRVAESRSHLREAHTTLNAIGATPWADQARAELRAAGERTTEQTPLGHELLSPQEAQIARLAADGLSNREIGERLFLSHRTVGSHLYRIFPKLDITSRAQLATRLQSIGTR